MDDEIADMQACSRDVFEQQRGLTRMDKISIDQEIVADLLGMGAHPGTERSGVAGVEGRIEIKLDLVGAGRKVIDRVMAVARLQHKRVCTAETDQEIVAAKAIDGVVAASSEQRIAAVRGDVGGGEVRHFDMM